MRPRIHVFGHIHEARGAQILRWDDGRETIFVNCATYPTKRGKYKPVRPGGTLSTSNLSNVFSFSFNLQVRDGNGTPYHLPIIVDIKT